MRIQFADGDEYLEMYPRFRKWINQCIACNTKGYKPEMPANDASRFNGQYLRRYFKPLSVNEVGLCEQCAAHRHGAQ